MDTIPSCQMVLDPDAGHVSKVSCKQLSAHSGNGLCHFPALPVLHQDV